MARNQQSPFLVEYPQIDEVLDLRSGEFIPTATAVGLDYEKIIQLRSKLHIATLEGFNRSLSF